MKLKIFTIGKVKSTPIETLVDKYLKRINFYLPVELKAIKNVDTIFKKRKAGEVIVACDEKGKKLTSKGFADFFKRTQLGSMRYITFVIGPSEGLSESAKDSADLLLSLSPMTLQHDLALIILSEQIYRAFTIIKGEPYHK